MEQAPSNLWRAQGISSQSWAKEWTARGNPARGRTDTSAQNSKARYDKMSMSMRNLQKHLMYYFKTVLIFLQSSEWRMSLEWQR